MSSSFTWSDNPMISGVSPCEPTKVNDNLMFLKENTDSLSNLPTELSQEINNRTSADQNLQAQIDALSASANLKDIVGTYQELLDYDTSTLNNGDIIKVLTDSTHDNAPSYYRYNSSTSSFDYIGSEAVSYTKAEADGTFVFKTFLINNKSLTGTGIVLNSVDIKCSGEYSSTVTYNNTSVVYSVSSNVMRYYLSKVNGNVGRPLTNTTYWQPLNLGGVTITWGSISGSITNQSDLQQALNSKSTVTIRDWSS